MRGDNVILGRPRLLHLRFTPTCVGTIRSFRIPSQRSAVHPHMRGDNGIPRRFFIEHHGSPPHAWGQCSVYPAASSSPAVHPHMRGDNRAIHVYLRVVVRFTPTCVGTIPARFNCTRLPPVHPHMRGDNVVPARRFASFRGSPPHAWGQFEVDAVLPVHHRFTPTCVGTIHSYKMSRRGVAVHPHMRGDNENANIRQGMDGGSPPHAWGQFISGCLFPVFSRFTPTCVGTISPASPPWRRFSVHPHMRGDNKWFYANQMQPTGSPPHAWGQSPAPAGTWPGSRFTPTCVGTIDLRHHSSHAVAVHPHMRGDNRGIAPHTIPKAGSPPHAWGQYRQRHGASGDGRFTPTCVGTITMQFKSMGQKTVHPHMRGDNFIMVSSSL